MTNTTEKNRDFGDFQSTTLKTRVTHMEIKEIKGTQTLVLKLAHRLGSENEVRLVIFNTNGLMTAFRNGSLVVGQDLTITGSIRSIRSHYTNGDGVLVPLKFPELVFYVRDFDFGAKPKAVGEEQSTAEPGTTAEEIPAEQQPRVSRSAPTTIRRATITKPTTSEQVQQRFGRIAEIQEAIGEVEDREEALAF